VIVNNPPAELAGRVWMLGTGAYPIYLIRGHDHGLLVEGGISALGPVLRRQLAAMAVKDGYISEAVITHAHPDHVMAVPALRALFPGLVVSSSAAAAEVLNSEKALAFFKQIDQSLTEALSRRGEASEAAELPPDCSSIRVDRILHDGDTIAVDDMQWSVLATPGHSACSISLFEPQARVLIISDASGFYLPEHRYWWPNYFADFGQYVASLERLAALGADVLCLSHNAAVVGTAEVAGYFAGALAATRDYHRRIIAELNAGIPPRQLAEQLGAEVHARTNILPVEFFQKNCALLIKLSQQWHALHPDGC